MGIWSTTGSGAIGGESAQRWGSEGSYSVYFGFFWGEVVHGCLMVAPVFPRPRLIAGVWGGAGAAGASSVHMSAGILETSAIWNGSAFDECCH